GRRSPTSRRGQCPGAGGAPPSSRKRWARRSSPSTRACASRSATSTRNCWRGSINSNPRSPGGRRRSKRARKRARLADTLVKIDEEQVLRAIDDAETKAGEFDEVGKPTARAYRALDQVIAEQAAQARSLYRASAEVSQAAAALGADDGKLGPVRRAAA